MACPGPAAPLTLRHTCPMKNCVPASDGAEEGQGGYRICCSSCFRALRAGPAVDVSFPFRCKGGFNIRLFSKSPSPWEKEAKRRRRPDEGGVPAVRGKAIRFSIISPRWGTK